MTRRRQEITERVPTTPRKVVVYTDNLMTSTTARSMTASESFRELARSLADTLNTALVISTSFRFDPELNMLEILDPYNPRNNIQVKGITDYRVSVKLFLLPASADANNRPSALYVRQAMACVQKQLGAVRIDELVVSFTDISAMCRSSEHTTGTTDTPGTRHPQKQFNSEDDAGASTATESRASDDADATLGGPNDMTRYLKVWKALCRLRSSGEALRIGISDVNRDQLEHLCRLSGEIPDIVQVRMPAEEEEEEEEEEQDVDDHDVDSRADRPDDAPGAHSGVAAGLREYARALGISISAHADGWEMLGDRTFQTLAADFKINERFPTTEVPPQGYKMDIMRPRWVANYSVMQVKRGLVANRGYIVMASSDCVLDPNRVSRPPAYSFYTGPL